MKKPHVHKDVIIAYANGAEIEWKTDKGEWESIDNPAFFEENEYRIKPEREYPVTSLTSDELCEIWMDASGDYHGRISIANAAIKQYIIDTEGK